MDAKDDKSPGRGYYSEVITELKHPIQFPCGALKRTNLLWQVQTDHYAPVIKSLRPADKRGLLAPAKRWISYDEDRTIVSKLVGRICRALSVVLHLLCPSLSPLILLSRRFKCNTLLSRLCCLEMWLLNVAGGNTW